MCTSAYLAVHCIIVCNCILVLLQVYKCKLHYTLLFQTLQEALELKSKLERVNEQLQIKFQSDLEDLRHLADE